MSFDEAREIADAILFEGYLLYPYRSNATKNRYRWTFGVLAPPAHCRRNPDEHAWMQAQLLVERGCPVEGLLRFLHVQQRRIEERVEGGFVPVPDLEVDGTLYLTWEEAEIREIPFELPKDRPERSIPFVAEAAADEEPIRDRSGAVVGRIVREREAIRGRITVWTTPVGEKLARLTLRVENETPRSVPGEPRELAMRASCISTHVLLRGRFCSLLDPPAFAAAAARACANERCFPVLVGPSGSTDGMLVAPIVLYDYPRIAPESPGDLFDATEIDELLSLRAATLTEEEKRLARATDPRAAAIVDRIASMGPTDWERLHGTFRALERNEMVPIGAAPAPVAGAATRPVPAPLRAAEEAVGPDAGFPPARNPLNPVATPAAILTGTPSDPAPEEAFAIDVEEEHAPRQQDEGRLSPHDRFPPGTRVRLRPGARRSDAQDLLYAGMVGTVEQLVDDVDGRTWLALTVDGDPAAELHRWYGRYHYYLPEEVEVIAPSREVRP